LPLTHSNRVGLWNAECWQVNQHQYAFAGKSLCAKTFKSCVGSGDSSTRDQPEPSNTLYHVERELARFACLCYHPLYWLRLLTLAVSIRHCQYSYIFVLCWPSACTLQVTWIKKKSFATTALSNTFARSLLVLIHCNPSCPLEIKYFFSLIHIRLIWSNGFALNIGFEFQSNRHYIFQNNSKRTINSLVTRANMNELRRGWLTGVIIVLWRFLRNNGRAPMRTLIHCCRVMRMLWTERRAAACVHRMASTFDLLVRAIFSDDCFRRARILAVIMSASVIACTCHRLIIGPGFWPWWQTCANLTGSECGHL